MLNGHTADLKMLSRLVQGYKGNIFGDRGYISNTLKEDLANQDIELSTYHRNNMMPVQLLPDDKKLLRQCNKIETIFSLLKQQYNLVTSRYVLFLDILQEFMHRYVLIKSAIRISLNLSQHKIKLIHDSGYIKRYLN